MTTPSERPEINLLRRGKSRARLPGQGHFGDAGAFGDNAVQEIEVIGGINPFMTAGQHRDRAACKTGVVRRRVDAARQPRDDAEAGLAQRAREAFGEFHAGGRGVARADNGDQGPVQDRGLAAHRDERRRVVDHLQTLRVIRLAEADEFNAAGAGGFQFLFGVLERTNARRPRQAAAPRQSRQRRQRRARAAIMLHEVAEGARARYYGADATSAS
jgi:hypothetical protein